MKIEKFVNPKEQMCTLGRNSWDVPRLFALSKDLPIMQIPLDHMNIFKTYEKLTMREFVMHMKAVLDADMNYPIILDEDGEIMDGRHRVMKAMLKNLPTIKAVRFEKNPLPCRHNEEE